LVCDRAQVSQGAIMGHLFASEKGSGVTRTIELKMIDSPNPSQEFKL